MIKFTPKFMLAGVTLLIIASVGIGNYLLVHKVNNLEHQLADKAPKTELKSADELRSDYFYTETATLVSPHTLRLKMDKGEVDFVLIDLRAAADYKLGHIRGAINIPFDGTEDSINKVKQAMADGQKERRSQTIIYCYNSACMLGRKTGKTLAQHGIYVQELGIGYANWAKQSDIWNNPGETVNINDYIQTGDTAGELKPSAEFLNRPCSEDAAYSC